MFQIFIFGSSTAYGVGSLHGGLGDRLKNYLHGYMYQEDGPGEVAWIYNFAQPGATIDFVADTFPDQLKFYGKDARKRIAIVHIGSNNAKAVGHAEGFVSSHEDYATQMRTLLTNMKKSVDQLFVLGIAHAMKAKQFLNRIL